MESVRARSFGKVHVPHVGLHIWFPAGAVLALLLWVADEESACVPTWVVLTCDCEDEAEVGVCVQGRTGAALAGIPCEEPKEA